MQGSIFKRVQHVCGKGKPRWVRLPNPTPKTLPCPECGANLIKERETRYDCFWRTNGKLRSKTVATKHDATRFLATVVTETHNGTYQQTRPVTMNVVFDEWEKHLDVKLQQGRLKPSTKKAYLSMLRKHLRPAFGTCRSDRLSEHVVLEWERRYAALLAAGTVTGKYYNNLRGTLNVVLTWARQRGQRYLAHNPLTDIKPVPVERRERRFLEPEEITRLLDATKDPKNLAISEFPKWRKCLILLSFLDNSSARPVQIGGVDVNICHSRVDRSPRTPAVQFAIPPRGDHFVAHGRALWKLTGRGRTERAHRAVENAVRFPRASTGPFPSSHPRKTPKGP